MRDACHTYSNVTEVRGPLDNGVHYANLECGHSTRGSKVNVPVVGQAQYCTFCTDAKLEKIGEL